MLAYLNNPELKKQTVLAMELDIKAERLVKGHYWNGTNGCFVGCVIRGESHAKFEIELGIPRILAQLADRIFESLDYEDSKKFSIDYLKAIMPGADLTGVWDKLALWGLIDKKYGVINFAKKESTIKAIKQVAALYKRKIAGETIERSEWRAAYADAYAYADADADAYAYADADADAAAAADAYAYAAAAADAYAYAAAAAAAYAYAAADAYAYAAAARKKYRLVFAKKLVRLLKAAK